jgi:hypothetical protein
MSQSGILSVAGNDPQIPTSFITDDGTAIPIANDIEILGTYTVAQAIPVRTTGSGNVVTVEVQTANTTAATDVTQIGLASFNSANFTVDANGFVSLSGGTAGIDSLGVQSTSGTGTDPVLPTAGGQIEFEGGTVVAGTTPMQAVSTAANTVQIQAQISQALAAADATKIGLANFGSEEFQVDADGFTQFSTNAHSTAISSWNGAILETTDVNVSSDGATVTLSVENTGGGDLTVDFSDGFYTWDTTPAATISLTAGSDTSPTLNYVYFLQSTKTLTASTASWPVTEHAPIATVLCQSAGSIVTQEPYKIHVWTDHTTSTNDQGHIPHLNYWIRQQAATWIDGVSQTYTISGGPPNNVIFTTSSGNVLQLHNHVFPAFSGTPDIYVVNNFAAPFTVVTDLNQIIVDSTGATLVGRYYSLVIWGCVSEDDSTCKLYLNLPSGSYGNANGVLDDIDAYSNYTIPSEFRGTGFLISEWKLRQQAAGGGTFTSIDEIDLRGLFPSLSAGGGTSTTSEFIDNVFRILNVSDNTKKIAFDASAITTATTRTITMADYNINMAELAKSFPATSGTAVPALGVLTTAGAVTAAGTVPVATLGAASTLTVQVQTSQAIAATDATKIGLCSFDSSDFDVDANGFVQLDATIAQTYTTDSGIATPILNNINILGGPGIVITGSSSTISINAVQFTDRASSVTMTNDTGAFVTAAGVTLTTPASPTQGVELYICCTTANTVIVDAASTHLIRIGSLITSAGGTATSTGIGDSLDLRWHNASSTWIATSVLGTWVLA